jgi:hypothetical protein
VGEQVGKALVVDLVLLDVESAVHIFFVGSGRRMFNLYWKEYFLV